MNNCQICEKSLTTETHIECRQMIFALAILKVPLPR